MRVWRVCDARFSDLDGEGARLTGGRWNGAGVAAIYTSTTLALAVLETLVHFDADLYPSNHVRLEIEVPDSLPVATRSVAELPSGWRDPESPDILRTIGDRWLDDRRQVALVVPSVVLPEETNCILNPLHPDFGQIRVIDMAPFSFDPRLIRS